MTQIRNYLKGFLSVGSSFYAVMMFLLSTVFVFIPSLILVNNSREIGISFFQFIPISLSLLLFFIILNLGLVAKCSERRRKLIMYIEFTLGVLIWAQATILNWNYGVFDGKPIQWDQFLVPELVDIAMWILVPLTIWKLKDRLRKYILRVCLSLIFIQCIAVGYQLFSSGSYFFVAKDYNINNDFSFSKTQNVIIIILDTFQSDVFQEIIKEDATYAKKFEGFTYYRNTSAGYPTTKPSVPLILTGEFYDNSLEMNEFINDNYENHSIMSELKKMGYRTQSYKYISSVSEKYLALIRYTQFKISPQFVKKQFFQFRTGDTVNSTPHDLEFYNQLKRDFEVGDQQFNFKFYHLNGVHPPFKLNERLEVINVPFDRLNYKNQAKASLNITLELIERLKSKEVYDDSMIFIMGDHGMQSNAIGIDAKVLSEKSIINVPLYEDVVSGAMPLLLYKPLRAHGDMTLSDAPISLQDIPKTILTELNIDSSKFKGKSIRTVAEDEARTRLFYNYAWDDSWEKEYMPTMKKYEINGHVWSGASFTEVGELYITNGLERYQAFQKYVLGNEIKFYENGNSKDYAIAGFSNPEKPFTWTDGEYAVMHLSLDQFSNDLTMNIDAIGYLPGGKRDSQRVEIYVNNQLIKNLSLPVDQEALKHITIPAKALGKGQLVIAFKLLDAVSPAELGESDDPRKLGIALIKIIIQ